MIMIHSNPSIIDHSKNNIAEALTGNADIQTFMEKLSEEFEDLYEVSEDPFKSKDSWLFAQVLEHPIMTPEEKIVFIYHYAMQKGVSKGNKEVCSSCVVGPASFLFHKLLH